MALVGRGAAVAAVLGRPRIWDLSAGAAMLRATGGALRYRSGAEADLGALLGGERAPDQLVAAAPGDDGRDLGTRRTDPHEPRRADGAGDRRRAPPRPRDRRGPRRRGARRRRHSHLGGRAEAVSRGIRARGGTAERSPPTSPIPRGRAASPPPSRAARPGRRARQQRVGLLPDADRPVGDGSGTRS
jgi:hypothetical protein